MKEMFGYQVDAVAAALTLCLKSLKFFVEVKANTIGRPINSTAWPCTRMWN